MELVRSLGMSVIPAAIAISFFTALQKQAIDTKELIAANKESTDKQISSNKELIVANKDTTNLANCCIGVKKSGYFEKFWSSK
jgi:galactokinase